MKTPAPRGRRPPAGEPVLDRAFRLLGAFSHETPTLTLTQLTHRSGLPMSSTLRLAKHLARLGAMERLSSGEFTIGIRMLEIAVLAPRGHGLRSTALPYMEDLHRATAQHVQLAVREGYDGVIVERLSTTTAGKVLYYAGSRIPLHGTGLGLVLLAHAPQEVQISYLQRDLTLYPEKTPVGEAELRSKLDMVRRTRIAYGAREHPEPAESIAAPIFDRSESCIAALSVVGAQGTIERRAVEPAVMTTARAISRALDH